ncbi:nicotinate phosphoribosyltransferase [Chondromyces apiculatus]|uniref:Nicotinate phosphoribosyltransferase n=1 Tax=Chondromyces apiculatus DSM 436 TaxID=1192034 RepID=A0A017TG99_9BACT|nr:nicotinate phosphoribosyltransferase [Chondromyces apiculatus]EYF07850.1 Nicotinate phosphoribosyltransferase [Chondromyces apiculatus DSM 436]
MGVDALKTDLYQLTMAAGYFHRGLGSRTATCEMFVRRLPEERRYLLCMGIERVLQYLEELRFTEEQIAYLKTVPSLADAMTPPFADYLRAFRFRGDMWAMPEGTVFFAQEPVLRISAPLIEAQLVETFVLSAVNHASMVASKAARVVLSAGTAQVVEFGSRRTHFDAAVDAARAAYAAGFAATSNVEAGMRYGIPVTGTAAHMWTMAHPSEEAAFEAYVAVFPNASILLIDTYDTLEGARRAAAIARDKLKGVRIDSGDLAALSKGVRAVLDEAGCQHAKIVASGDVNEHKIAALRRAGAPIDIYGVGTDLVVSRDAPALGGVYKLVEVGEGEARSPIAKFSEGKATLPGAHQVFRWRGPAGETVRDVIALAGEDAPAGAEPLLTAVMRGGKRLASPETLSAVRARAKRELAALPAPLREVGDEDWAPLTAEVSPGLEQLIEEVRARVAPTSHVARED